MHTISIVISQTDTLLGKIIRKICKGEYNHCSFYLDNDDSKLWSFSRKIDYLFFTGCFCSETNKRYKKYKTFTYNLSDEDYEDIIREINKLNKSYHIYHYVNAILIRFNKSFDNPNHYICSTYVAHIVNDYHIAKLPKQSNLCLPMDLYNALILSKSNYL